MLKKTMVDLLIFDTPYFSLIFTTESFSKKSSGKLMYFPPPKLPFFPGAKLVLFVVGVSGV
jgi:hypothetical protein